MAAAGGANAAHGGRVNVEFGGVSLEPTGGVVHILHLGRIGMGRGQAEVHRRHHNAAGRQSRRHHRVIAAVAPIPRAPVNIQQGGKGANPLRPVQGHAPTGPIFPLLDLNLKLLRRVVIGHAILLGS